jgi:hypothetical protein
MDDGIVREPEASPRSTVLSRRGRLRWSSLLAFAFVSAGATNAPAEPTCKPILSVRKTSEERASAALPYRWAAKLVADTRHCATRSGAFEIDFIRIKENAPDMQFTGKFRWRAGRFEASIELTADEAVLDYRIGFIAPCVCRDFPFR